MELTYIKDYRIYLKVSYVTIIAAIMTMIITQIIKIIIKKKKINELEIEENKQDEIMSRIGRLVALIVYTILYLINEVIINKTVIIDKKLIMGLIMGSTMTLIVAKGIYTVLHQWSKKKNIYERLKYAEEINQKLTQAINELKDKNIQTTWILKNNKDK